MSSAIIGNFLARKVAVVTLISEVNSMCSVVTVVRNYLFVFLSLALMCWAFLLTPAECAVQSLIEQYNNVEACPTNPACMITSQVRLSSDDSNDTDKYISLASVSEKHAIWIGPMPFIEGRTLRGDYFSEILDSFNESTIWEAMAVFKSYLMILPTAPIPGNTEPEASDSQLMALIEKLEQLGVDTAFEVGGARSRASGSGRNQALNEFAHLERWLKLGGRIDYLTTDHSLMRGLDAWLEVTDPAESANMS